ncbi:hypothetical protein BaRGS_00000547 [Batillaria attramentaria]|uniref:Uncharacterized protein n=1 Tax=Batillaria attramentaria TaxID=370345 RepID=A0ABD0MAZ2_9CAEN
MQYTLRQCDSARMFSKVYLVWSDTDWVVGGGKLFPGHLPASCHDPGMARSTMLSAGFGNDGWAPAAGGGDTVLWTVLGFGVPR